MSRSKDRVIQCISDRKTRAVGSFAESFMKKYRIRQRRVHVYLRCWKLNFHVLSPRYFLRQNCDVDVYRGDSRGIDIDRRLPIGHRNMTYTTRSLTLQC